MVTMRTIQEHQFGLSVKESLSPSLSLLVILEALMPVKWLNSRYPYNVGYMEGDTKIK
jgi:hypothetical protein